MTKDKPAENSRVLHAYVRQHLFMEPSEHADLVARFVALAEREGFTLGKVFTEKPETVPAAFTALVRAVVDDEAAAVAVPSLHHFAVMGPPDSVKNSLERVVGVPVLVSGARP